MYLNKCKDERNDLIIQSGLSADLLETNFSDLRGFFEAKGRAEKRLEHLTTTLQFKEKERNEILEQINQLEPGGS
jgi:DNA sulfur modification protein DndD